MGSPNSPTLKVWGFNQSIGLFKTDLTVLTVGVVYMSSFDIPGPEGAVRIVGEGEGRLHARNPHWRRIACTHLTFLI